MAIAPGRYRVSKATLWILLKEHHEQCVEVTSSLYLTVEEGQAPRLEGIHHLGGEGIFREHEDWPREATVKVAYPEERELQISLSLHGLTRERDPMTPDPEIAS